MGSSFTDTEHQLCGIVDGRLSGANECWRKTVLTHLGQVQVIANQDHKIGIDLLGDLQGKLDSYHVMRRHYDLSTIEVVTDLNVGKDDCLVPAAAGNLLLVSL